MTSVPSVRTSLLRTVRRARGVSDAAGGRPELRALVAAEVDRCVAERTARDADLEFSLQTLVHGRTGADRRLNAARFDALARQVERLTATPAADVRWRLAQAYMTLLDAEARGLGRMAGSTYNILGKLVVPPLLSAPDGPMLEIGTLYGLFSPALVRSFRRRGEFRELTVVDPLAGAQLQGGKPSFADPSGTPVVEPVVRCNFGEFGLADTDVRVVAGLSTDPGVRAVAGDRRYALVVIDGDHYEDGVAQDLRWVETLLLPGGIAVLDDYGDAKWPGVEAAVSAYLAAGGRMELLGTASTSGYLRLPA